jgi:hypothetical protein
MELYLAEAERLRDAVNAYRAKRDEASVTQDPERSGRNVTSPTPTKPKSYEPQPALPMLEQFVALWGCMSGGEKAGVHSFLAAELAKFETVNRPAAPAAQNGAATGIATS